jgi:hypothetical protein
MVQNQVATRISQGDYSRMLNRCADGGCSPYEYLQKLIIDDLNSYSEHLKTDNPGGITIVDEFKEKFGVTPEKLKMMVQEAIEKHTP